MFSQKDGCNNVPCGFAQKNRENFVKISAYTP